MTSNTSLQPLDVGIVIPTYKEGENIQTLIRALLSLLPVARIVVVDDSPDRSTVDCVEALKAPQVEVIHRTTKGGRGSAVLEGMRILLNQGCRIIVEMDSDLSHPPEQMLPLVDELKSRKLDLLIASRYLPSSEIRNWPLTRRIFSRCSNILARLVLRVPIADYTNGYRIYSRAGAEVAAATSGKLGTGFIALSEILVNLFYRGHPVGETPTVFINRIRGESSVSYIEVSGALFGLYRIYWLKRELKATWQAGEKLSKKSGSVVA